MKSRLRRLVDAARPPDHTPKAGTAGAPPLAPMAPVEDDTHGQPVDLGSLQLPTSARHAELSLIASLDDSPGTPDAPLLRAALGAAEAAMTVDLRHLHMRSEEAAKWLSIYPGEHYQLLSGLMRTARPSLVVEVGTFTGLSALAILDGLAPTAQLVTFDVVPWDRLADPALRHTDFADGRLRQVLADLAVPDRFAEHADLLAAAEVLFVDGPKDGQFEPAFWELLRHLPRRSPCLLMLDDIRVWSMLDFWRRIGLPKLDLTSFGHWSGTGLVRLDAS